MLLIFINLLIFFLWTCINFTFFSYCIYREIFFSEIDSSIGFMNEIKTIISEAKEPLILK